MDITIIVVTYNRPREIRETITALNTHLKYTVGDLHWMIADDASPNNYGNEAIDWVKTNISNHASLSLMAQNGGWGRNVNRAIEQCHSPLYLLIEDDYVLTHPINLDPHALILMREPSTGIIRLDGILGHRIIAELREFDLHNHQDGRGLVGKYSYWHPLQESPELWIYSNRPHLTHRKRWHEFYGMYEEGLKLGDTESNMAWRYKDAMIEANAPQIIVPTALTLGYFDHIGVTYQGTEHDR